ncbi:hypothetical protein TRVL_10380 [Trypanosoma vivax]|nr:hypothetical protein TRVL_10380 [Trypanosoma vivax]
MSVVLLCVPHSSAPLGLVGASATVSSDHTLRCHAPIRVLAGCTRLRNHASAALRAPNSIVTAPSLTTSRRKSTSHAAHRCTPAWLLTQSMNQRKWLAAAVHAKWQHS